VIGLAHPGLLLVAGLATSLVAVLLGDDMTFLVEL
jgi:hypothetical protein